MLAVSLCGCVSQSVDFEASPVDMNTPDPQEFFNLLTTEQRASVATVTPPYPTTTRFDNDPEERKAYLQWYSEGYRFGLTGTMVHALWGQFPHREAVIEGWDTGQGDGWLTWSKKNLLIDKQTTKIESANK